MKHTPAGYNALYERFLKRMLVMEAAGEIIYTVLAAKSADEKLKDAYRTLAADEFTASDYIHQELRTFCKDSYVPREKFVLRYAVFLFRLLSPRLLQAVVRESLKRQTYRRWHDRYYGHNPVFWERLKQHETQQATRAGLTV